MIREFLTPNSLPALTMSEIRESQCEAREFRLMQRERLSIFDPLTTEFILPDLLAGTYYDHCPEQYELKNLDALRLDVSRVMPREARYIGREEKHLLVRLLDNGGRLILSDDDDIGAAEALVNRLWCSFTSEEDGWCLIMPENLRDILCQVFEEHGEEDDKKIDQFETVLYAFLYMYGVLPSESIMDIFLKNVIEASDPEAIRIAERYLKSCCEYISYGKNRFLLLHPGVIDPYRLVESMNNDKTIHSADRLPPDVIACSIIGILPEEMPLHDQLCAALHGDLRPGIDMQETAEDLRILVKQGVSLEKLEQVLSNLTMVMLTPRMREALRQLYLRTPRWISFQSGLIN